MMSVGAITGGIACGKSHCLREFGRLFPTTSFLFSCDEAVSNLLTQPEIVGSLVEGVGDSILKSDGTIDRIALRERVFANSKIRKKVEGVLHPAVFHAAEAFLKSAKKESLVLFEVPLLYEVDFPISRDFEIVVGCSPKTQLNRLMNLRSLTLDFAEKVIGVQMGIQDKVDRADYVIWNDGCLEVLDDQIQTLSKTIVLNAELHDGRN
jgi:dephospho-CoA kinase